MVFVGESPRFANANLGWIHLGEQVGTVGNRPYYKFGGLHYRPPQAECEAMFSAGDWVWNTGYFVTSVGYMQRAYAKLMPEMWAQLSEIGAAIDTAVYPDTLNRLYPHLQKISFDDAILSQLDLEGALVIHAPMGWSDPGTLYALKEAINPDEEAVVSHGRVIANHSRDSLIYNYEPHKLVMGVGLDGYIVINTPDALLVVHKDNVPLVKEIVEGFAGTDLEQYG